MRAFSEPRKHKSLQDEVGGVGEPGEREEEGVEAIRVFFRGFEGEVGFFRVLLGVRLGLRWKEFGEGM